MAGTGLLAWLSWSLPAAAAEPVSVLPSPCVRRATLETEQYKKLGRFVALGGGYAQWEQMDCYPTRLDDAALATTDQPVGHVVSFGSGDAFVVGIEPAWFNRCTKAPAPVRSTVAIGGDKLLALKQHLADLPEGRSLDLREIGFAEAELRDSSALFALYLGTPDRNVYLECFEDLDAAVVRAFEELAGSKPKP